MGRRAYFNDGKTAARHDVTLEMAPDGLRIIDLDGDVLTHWPLEEMRQVGGKRERPRRYKVVGGHQRLTLGDEDDGAWIDTVCPNLTRADGGRIRWPIWAGAAGFAVVSALGILLFLLPVFAGWAVNAIPVALEQRIGKAYVEQALDFTGQLKGRSHVEVCRSTDAERILQRRADEIATLLDSPFPIKITVIRLSVNNALTFPGGRILILSGLLEKARSGDEVIGVLAHEIAHVVRRDAMQVSIKQSGAALLAGLLVGDVFGGAAVAGAAATVVETGYSRDAEASSDALAVTALNQLGLTARPFADFLERMNPNDGLAGHIPEFLSTHPAGDTRAREIRRRSQGNGRAMTNYEWRTLRNMCNGSG